MHIDLIGVMAFCGSVLNEINFCDNIKKIGEQAFKECKINGLTLPKNLEEIDNNAFLSNWGNYRSRNLISIDTLIIPKNIKKIGNTAFEYVQINNLIFESDSIIEIIGNYAFNCCNINYIWYYYAS